MSNVIITQQGDSPVVADSISESRLVGVTFFLGLLAGGSSEAAAAGRLTTRVM